jgi:putative spermidine/putrescine transport system ATP-binding protein
MTIGNVDASPAAGLGEGHESVRNTAPALELSAVVKRYGAVTAVSGVDLVVDKGECVTLLGPSGSGKTTLLRIVAGFSSATSGGLRINGRDISTLSPAKRGIGMVFQDYALFPHLNVADNVAYGLKVRGWPRERRADRVAEMLEVVGLARMEDRLPRQLSGGQQQRVALARALAFHPDLLLMDEPLGALDRELRVRMTGELRRIQRELETTLVYVTHDRDEALTLSDRIAIMRDGRIEGLGAPQALYEHPHTQFIARFFGWHNVVDVDVVRTDAESVTISWHGARFDVPIRSSLDPGRQTLVVPTRALRAAGDGDGPEVSGVVLEALYMGDEVRVRMRLADGEIIVAHLPAAQTPAPVGDTLRLDIEPARLTVVPRET